MEPTPYDVLFVIRDGCTRHAPLAMAIIDDIVNLTGLTVALTAGLHGESTGRFDVQWTTEGDYGRV